MRLAHLHRGLSDRFSRAAAPRSAQALYERIFWTCYLDVDPDVRADLEDDPITSGVARRELPEDENLQQLSEQADERYFGLEEAGEMKLSAFYFCKARLLASLAQASRAACATDYAEAAYEALMACDDPEAVSEGQHGVFL